MRENLSFSESLTLSLQVVEGKLGFQPRAVCPSPRDFLHHQTLSKATHTFRSPPPCTASYWSDLQLFVIWTRFPCTGISCPRAAMCLAAYCVARGLPVSATQQSKPHNEAGVPLNSRPQTTLSPAQQSWHVFLETVLPV